MSDVDELLRILDELRPMSGVERESAARLARSMEAAFGRGWDEWDPPAEFGFRRSGKAVARVEDYTLAIHDDALVAARQRAGRIEHAEVEPGQPLRWEAIPPVDPDSN